MPKHPTYFSANSDMGNHGPEEAGEGHYGLGEDDHGEDGCSGKDLLQLSLLSFL